MINKSITAVLSLMFAIAISFGSFAEQTMIDSVEVQPSTTASISPSESIEITEGTFKNVSAKAIEEGAKITWSIDYKTMELLEKEGYKLFIKHNTDIGAKRHKEGYENSDWSYSEALELSTTSYSLKNLAGNEKYKFKIGISKDGSKKDASYSKSGKFKTDRDWGVAKLLILIGALAFFIYGMKIMSEGLQQAAGSRLRKLLGFMTGNRVKGVITGFMTTAVVQSSSVTTVMTVSFVNAGLMNLRQSAGVMLGANIGTTITGWLILLIGFKVSIGDYAYMIMAIALPLLFFKREKSKALVSTLFGFCILFIGLGALKAAVPSLSADNPLVLFFTEYKNAWYGPLMFVILGALVTVIIQSSSAAMALTLTLVSAGLIPFEVACAMVLGENIGTTITAELASLIANVHAKRSARIHSLFNLVGVAWMLIFMLFAMPTFLKVMGYLVSAITGEPFDVNNPEMSNTGIALFHTLFNITNVLIMIWFIPQLVKIAEKMVKSKGDADEEFHLDFIGGGILTSPEVALLEAKKEVAKFGNTTSRMNGFIRTVLNSSDKKEKQKMFSKLKKYEEITDRVEIEITEYLSKASRLEMSEEASMRTRGMMNITTDLERIGDIYYQMGKALEKKENEKIWFSPEQRDGMNHMLDLLKKSFETMNENLNAEYGAISIGSANDREREINQFRDELRRIHLVNIESEDYNMASGLIFANLFASCEKVGDHIINVSEAVAGEYTN
jgi:phosphate:Na+ symporter